MSLSTIVNYTDTCEQKKYEALVSSASKNGVFEPISFLLQRAYRLYSDNCALIEGDRSVTYKELYYRACLLSVVIAKEGVNKGDRILLLFENSIQFYIAYFAALHVGAVVVPLNIFLKEKELGYIVNDAQPSLIITNQEGLKRFQACGQPLPSVITDESIDMVTPVPAHIDEFPIDAPHDDELIVLLYTSGTTGFPKGVMLSSKNIMTNACQSLARFDMHFERERIFAALPLFHSFAQSTCIWMSFFAGCTVIVVPKIERRFIIKGLEHKPTIFLGVPALFGLLCLLKTAPLDSVKIFCSGGDAMPDKIRSAFALLYRRKICSGYGLTETSPVITIDLDGYIKPTNTVGEPLIGIECQLRDEQGVPVPAKEVGVLWVRSDAVMLGYYNEPTMTAEVIQDGWFCTGDLVRFDSNGKIVICGRMKDLIIHKGFNIYPQEIENVISLHHNVVRVGVIGIQDVDTGEVPVAYVQLHKEQKDIERVLKRLCLEHLASYKIPKRFVCSTEALPITATGKVNKKLLKRD